MSNYVLEPTQEGQLRRRTLFWLPAPLPVLGVVYLMLGGTLSASGWTILLSASLGVGTLLLAVIVQPTPLPEGLTPQVSARRALHRFRQFTGLRIVLALVLVIIGASASVIGGGMYPLLAAVALAWPQILMAMPTFFTITRARRAMEAWGTTAYLWHALSRPAAVTWPLVTPAVRTLRQWRRERAQARATNLREAELRRSEEQEREQARDPHVVVPGPDSVATARIPSLSGDEATVNAEAGAGIETGADSGGTEAGEAEATADDARSGPGATGAAGEAAGEQGPEDSEGTKGAEENGEQEASGTDLEKTDLLEPVGEEIGEADRDGAEDTDDRAGEDEVAPTAAMPVVEEPDHDTGTPGSSGNTGSERTGSTLIERGGALSQRVRRSRRGAQSTRRPHPHKP